MLQTRSGKQVRLGSVIATGGQAVVWSVRSPRGVVLKQYRPEYLVADPTLERRLVTMLDNRPQLWRESSSGHVVLAWPSDIVDELIPQRHFVGFLMPVIDTSSTVELHRVTNPSEGQYAMGPIEWVRSFTWRYKVVAATNLARAAGVLHASGCVIGDFNERNVRVSQEARITLLDCDSMQVSAHGGRYFCRVGRLEFTPPELVGADWRTTVRHPSSDLFALAIHCYQLLLEGEHPFRGVWSGPGEKPSVAALARQGVWAYSGDQLTPRPTAPDIGMLPGSVVALFRRAFEDGARNPFARPTAADWKSTLAHLSENLRECRTDRAHVYDQRRSSCPWCERNDRRASRRIGRARVPMPRNSGAAPVTARAVASAQVAARVATALVTPPGRQTLSMALTSWWNARVYLFRQAGQSCALGVGIVLGVVLACAAVAALASNLHPATSTLSSTLVWVSGFVVIAFAPGLQLLRASRYVRAALRVGPPRAPSIPSWGGAGPLLLAVAGAFAASFAAIATYLGFTSSFFDQPEPDLTMIIWVHSVLLPPVAIVLACLLIRPERALPATRRAAGIVVGFAILPLPLLKTGQFAWLSYSVLSGSAGSVMATIDQLLGHRVVAATIAAWLVAGYSVARLWRGRGLLRSSPTSRMQRFLRNATIVCAVLGYAAAAISGLWAHPLVIW